jgi:hypothetical protein
VEHFGRPPNPFLPPLSRCLPALLRLPIKLRLPQSIRFQMQVLLWFAKSHLKSGRWDLLMSALR